MDFRTWFEEGVEGIVAAVAITILGFVFVLGQRFEKMRKAEQVKALSAERDRLAGLLETCVSQRERSTKEHNAVSAQLSTLQANVADIRQATVEGEGALLRAVGWPPELVDPAPRIPIYAIGNLKGGVGKTTLAANLGAALGDQNRSPRPRPVLFLDLDFQGSLSAILGAAGQQDPQEPDPRSIGAIAQLFDGGYEPAVMLQLGRPIFRGEMSGSKFYDAAFEAAGVEERLLFRWVLGETDGRDPRLALASFLWSQQVQTTFSAVVLDLPPRPSLFQYAALIAATDVLLPTRDDTLSTRAASRFAGFIRRGADAGLWPRLRIAGVVGVNTDPLHSAQEAVDTRLRETARGVAAIFGQEVPVLGKVPYMRVVAQNAARDLAYFEKAQAAEILGKNPHQYFSEIRESLATQSIP